MAVKRRTGVGLLLYTCLCLPMLVFVLSDFSQVKPTSVRRVYW